MIEYLLGLLTYGVIMVIVEIYTAPEGYEDEHGFHRTKDETKNRIKALNDEVERLLIKCKKLGRELEVANGDKEFLNNCYEKEMDAHENTKKDLEDIKKNCDATQALNRELEARIDELVGKEIKQSMGIAI